MIDVLDRSPALGATTLVQWDSQGADSCVLTVGGTELGTGLTGSAEVLVDGLVVPQVACLPLGLASIARMPVAPACQDTIVVDNLTTSAAGPVDGDGDPIVVGPTDCVDAVFVTIDQPDPATTARIRSGDVFVFTGSTDSDAWARFESGSMFIDYCNGYLPGSHYLYPVLETNDSTLGLRDGRADVRTVVEPQLFVLASFAEELDDRRVVLDLPARLGSLYVGGTTALPLITTAVTSVAGDVTIRDNLDIDAATIDAFVQSLGTVEGTLTVCGNLEDDPCQ